MRGVINLRRLDTLLQEDVQVEGLAIGGVALVCQDLGAVDPTLKVRRPSAPLGLSLRVFPPPPTGDEDRCGGLRAKGGGWAA
jgi:hypothetical protein